MTERVRSPLVPPPVVLPAATALALLGLACAAGCQKTAATHDEPASASAPDSVDGASPELRVGSAHDVAPPTPVVAADPSIPLHEAVVGSAPVAADHAAPVAPPPAPAVEEQPPQPEADDAWIPGYWWYSPPLTRYVWVSGAWRHPPPDQVWTPGTWSPVEAHFVWSPGYWGPQGFAQVTVDVAPPALRVEASIPSPGVGFAWTPGFYGYRDGGYFWSEGSWVRPPSAGLLWVEPRYVAFGARYRFEPGRWDFPPERRGRAYLPDIHVRPGERCRFAPAPPSLVSEHARFVSSSAHAIAMGGRRMPGGGFSVPRPEEEHARGGAPRPPEGPGEHGPVPHLEHPEPPRPQPGPALRGPAPAEEHRAAPPPEHHAAPSFEHAPDRRKH